MSGKCPHEKTKKHIYSERQKRFFYPVESGKARKTTSMTPEQAKHHLEKGKKQKGKLPERSSLKTKIQIRRKRKQKG